MSDLLLTFTNLFPSSAMPTHGLFVRERMRRVAAASGCEWQVVAPVPHVAWIVRNGLYKRWATVPRREVFEGTEVHHPRYRHWPGLSMRRQADAMASGALPVVETIARGRRCVIDAHYLWPDGVAAAEVAGRLGLPYVLTARGSDLNVIANDRAIAARIAQAAQGASACMAVSTALCDRFAAVTGLPRDRIQLARNGVDLGRFSPGDVAARRAQLGLPAAAFVLVGVGRLVAGKGFDVAARALAQLPEDVHLVLVGDGPERSKLRELGGDRIHLLGTQAPDQVAAAYQAGDLFVLPSEREGWPNVVTEALAAGLRVVATAVGGIPEVLDLPAEPGATHPSRGALIGRGDEAALAAAVVRLREQPVDRAVVRDFAQRYGWQQPVEMLVATLRAALGKGRVA